MSALRPPFLKCLLLFYYFTPAEAAPHIIGPFAHKKAEHGVRHDRDSGDRACHGRGQPHDTGQKDDLERRDKLVKARIRQITCPVTKLRSQILLSGVHE